MQKSAYIFEVSETNFEQVVVQNSDKIPVVTLFMGVWSEPCFTAAEIFTQLAKEFPEAFIFAKVDVDEQAGLKESYQVEQVPTIKVFSTGTVCQTHEGLLSEDEARALLRSVGVYNPADDLRAQAREQHLKGETQAAIILLSQAIQQDPSNTQVALDMVQIFIDLKEFEQANGLFNKLPETARESDMGRSVSGQLTFINLAAGKPTLTELKQAVLVNPDDSLSRFDLAVCLTAEYQYSEAIDQLFILQQEQPDFREGAAKELLTTLITMLKNTHPEIAQPAQTRLANLLSN